MTVELDVAGPPAEQAAERSRALHALAERDRFEQVLRLLAAAPPDGSPCRVACVLAEAACVLAGARVVWLVMPELLPGVVSSGPDAASIEPATQPTSWPLLAAALEGRAVQVPDTLDRSAAGVAGPARWAMPEPVVTFDGRPLRCFSAFPLGDNGSQRGALVLGHHRARAFSERQSALVGALVRHLGHVLEMSNAVLEQTRISTALQETLLPPVLPVVEGVELAARYRPSGSGNLVGGDFYDVFSDGAGGWYVLLGDASGIGPEAAGLAGVARYTARALAETATGPAEMLAQMNRALLRAAPEDRFCSAVIGRLRALGGGRLSVVLASGGHPPPLVQRRGDSLEPSLASTGLLLGIMPDAPVGEGTLVLDPGDAVTFYTDGVIEAHGEDGQLFGETRLRDVLAGAEGRSAAGVARRLERAVVDFRSPDDRDDLAIVVARCRPAGARPGT